MSAGQLFDLIMPAAFAVSALVSTWVLASARKRFQLHYALILAIGTLFLPLIVLPVYLVLMMYRIGRAGRGDATTALKYGLDQLGIPGQFAPKHVFVAGGLTTDLANSLSAVSTLSVICAEPVLTMAMPSRPTEAVMFVPSAISM